MHCVALPPAKIRRMFPYSPIWCPITSSPFRPEHLDPHPASSTSKLYRTPSDTRPVFSHPSPPSLFHLFHPPSPSRATSSKWAPSSSRPPPAAQTPPRSPPTSTACYISSVSLASTRTSCRSSPPPWSASTPRRIRLSSPITRTRYTRTSRSVFSRRPPPRTPLFPHSSCTSTPPIQPSRTARVSPPPPPRAHGSPSIRRRVFSHSPSLNSRRLFFTSALLHLSRTTRISHLPVHAPQADTSPFMPILFAHACAPINLPRRRHFV